MVCSVVSSAVLQRSHVEGRWVVIQVVWACRQLFPDLNWWMRAAMNLWRSLKGSGVMESGWGQYSGGGQCRCQLARSCVLAQQFIHTGAIPSSIRGRRSDPRNSLGSLKYTLHTRYLYRVLIRQIYYNTSCFRPSAGYNNETLQPSPIPIRYQYRIITNTQSSRFTNTKKQFLQSITINRQNYIETHHNYYQYQKAIPTIEEEKEYLKLGQSKPLKSTLPTQYTCSYILIRYDKNMDRAGMHLVGATCYVTG